MNGCRGICVVLALGSKLDSSPSSSAAPPDSLSWTVATEFCFHSYPFLQLLLPIQADICAQAILSVFFIVLGTALLNLLNSETHQCC
jgi:hypothetical protein